MEGFAGCRDISFDTAAPAPKRHKPTGAEVLSSIKKGVCEDANEIPEIEEDSSSYDDEEEDLSEAVSQIDEFSSSGQCSNAISPRHFNLKSLECRHDEDSSVGIEEDEEKYSDQSESSQYVICNPSESPEQDASAKCKLSSWLQKLKSSKTPEKYRQDDSSDEEETDDNSLLANLKVQKKGGLVERLKKLESRERSDLVMWKHEVKSGTLKTEPSSSLTVKLLKLTKEDHVYFATCDQIVEETEPSPRRQLFKAVDKDGNLQNMKRILLLLHKDVVTYWALTEGCVIRIFKPWQMLQRGQEIPLVQASFIRILSNELIQYQPKEETRVILEWTCPCQEDAELCPVRCSKKLVLDRNIQFEKLRSGQVSVNIDSCIGDSGSTVDAIQSMNPVIPESLLDAIERNGCTSNLSFLATIQRVLHFHSENEETSDLVATWGLLLQDNSGMICEVSLSNGVSIERYVTPQDNKLEGCTYMFSGLKLTQKIIRRRSAALFSMIAAITHNQSNTMPDNDALQVQVTQEFCYLLSACSENFSMQKLEGISSRYIPSRVQLLADVEQKADGNRECICVKVVHQRNNKLYVVDESVAGFKSTETSLSHVVCISVNAFPITALCSSLKPSCTLLLKDVLVSSGELTADKYSRCECTVHNHHQFHPISQQIVLADKRMEILSSFRPACEDFDLSARALTLVNVSGFVEGVDEENAYMWPVCDSCQSENINGDNTDQVWCVACKRVVLNPQIRMKLEVFLRCQSMPPVGNRVQLKLKQETIDSILPENERSDEGYDVQCILNKPIGPIRCFVENVSLDKSQFNLQEI